MFTESPIVPWTLDLFALGVNVQIEAIFGIDAIVVDATHATIPLDRFHPMQANHSRWAKSGWYCGAIEAILRPRALLA